MYYFVNIQLKSHRKLATNNPQFSQLIKKALTFPMHSSIDIQVWDYDIIKNDELIGSAVIDIENRMLAKLGSFNCNNPI